MKNTYIKYSALVALIAASSVVYGQETNNNEITIEHQASLYQWNKTSNAAGLLLDKPIEISKLEAGYSSTNGNLKMPQIGKTINDTFLKTSGNLYQKNYYIQGHFNYNRNTIKEADYNASLIDPLRNMPYIVADTNSSDWLNQHYDLGFKFVTKPIADKVSLGFTANYKAQSGAKQRDIRTNNKYYELQLEPSVVYSINEQHNIGASILYKNYKEESTNSNVNVYVDQGYFVLFGLGNALKQLGSGYTINYEANAAGAGLQYQFNGPIKALISVNYSEKDETANRSFTNTRPLGSILEKKWITNLDLQKSGEAYTQLVNANYTTSKSNGIEYINEFVSGLASNGYYTRYKSVRSKYNTTNAQFRYDLIKNQGNIYNWKAAAFVEYSKLDNKYLIPSSVMNAENVTYGLSFNKLFTISESNNSLLGVGAKVAIKTNLDGEYKYKGGSSEELTVTDLEKRNFEYYTADYTSYEVPVVYSQRLKENSNTQLFVKASGQVLTTNSFDFNNRKMIKFSVGATF